MDTGRAVIQDTEQRMKKTLEVVHQNFGGIRSGRANPAMLDAIRVDYYGTPTPVKQMANITVPEPKVLMVHPWDISAIKAIEKGILESDLGINPIVDGKVIRLVVPTLTRERREELVKIVNKVSEDGRVALRSIRREANEQVKALEKEKKITEDESFKFQSDIQKLTDKHIQLIDLAQGLKDKELTQV
ncbi:MAG: ribosome recycling factor [Candidatus Omnitrophica bacterium]|nr:ribosome recycling factor [Candidatus Omnitrophota bacterium]